VDQKESGIVAAFALEYPQTLPLADGFLAMSDLLHLNLIRLFGFYLAATFLIGLVRRLQMYSDAANLVATFPRRWPKLSKLIQEHQFIFLGWATFRPALITLLLMIMYMTASRVIWPKASISAMDLVQEWWLIPVIGLFGLSMIALDTYTLIRVSKINQPMFEPYLDEAEHWLTSWTAPLVSVVTFGYVRPRRIVETEVEKVMTTGRDLLHRSLWWMSAQYGLRIGFGLSLWTAWLLGYST